MARGQGITIPHLSTTQTLSAGIVAGALALYVWAQRRKPLSSGPPDTPDVGSEDDEIVLYGKVICSTAWPCVELSENWCSEKQPLHVVLKGLKLTLCGSGFERLSDVVASFSPYVAKVEAWLRMVGLPYTKKIGNPASSPKGQVAHTLLQEA